MRLWFEVIVWCLRASPVRTVGVLVLLVADIAAVGVLGLCLREITDAVSGGDRRTVLVAAVGGALAFLVISAGTGARFGLMGNLGERVGLRVDEEVLRTATGLPSIEHVESPAYLDRLSLVLGRGSSLVYAALAPLASVSSIIGIGVSTALLSQVHPVFAPVVIFAAIPLLLSRRGERLIREASLASAQDARLERQLFDLLTQPEPGKEVRVSGRGGDLMQRRRNSWHAVHKVRTAGEMRAAGLAVAGWAVFMLAYVAGLGFVVWLVARGERTPGDLVLAVTLAAQLRGQVERTLAMAREALAGVAVIEPFLWLREHARRLRDDSGGRALDLDRLRSGIELESVWFRYPEAKHDALVDVSIHLPAGSTVAVVGEYGSGKSTLVKLLLGLHQPDRGSITVDGIDLRDVDLQSWRASTSAVFQDFGRYQLRLRESIGIGDLPAVSDHERVEHVARAAGADAASWSLPDGMDTQLGTLFSGTELSEGQWQKVALARGTMRRGPLLVVMDEPTAALDAPSEHAMFERYTAIARKSRELAGTVTVIVSHRLSTIDMADLILMMSNGRILEAGDHQTLMAAGGPYAEMFRLHQVAHSTTAAEPEH
ncbi:ABC transporter ATP-binding protein [Paractinoplanes rishiriensis]|uniref:ABC transporter ATP-binding protein n=1 Tax=Paractinoplanes rishiriensis TaxID=1050105 RepID=UPI0019418320|nr:ABC transporter ATP-binding protein [Actinoplanes rishiriensis]